MSLTTTTTITSPSLHDFPPEIIQQFLSQIPHYELPYSPEIHEMALRSMMTRTISACRLTCRYLNAIARPFHFHTVALGFSGDGTPRRSYERITQFHTLLEEDPTIAPNVHTLQLYGARFESFQSQRLELTSELWTNEELPRIFARLTSLKRFAFEAQPTAPHLTSLAVNWDCTLGMRMQRALRHLILMPSVVSLKFSHLAALPMDLIIGCPNLQHLEVESIDDMSKWGSYYLTPVRETTPRSGSSWKIESIKAGMMCNSLLSVLGYSRDTLRDLTIHLGREMNFLDPRLDQYKSLVFLRVWHTTQTASPAYIGSLSAFLTAQFKHTSLSITRLEVQVVKIQDSDFLSHFLQPICVRPIQWQRLEDVLQESFPCLSELVLELQHKIKPEGAERFKVFAKWALPVMTEMQSVRVLLRYGLIYGYDEMQEVDMTGVDVDVPAYILQKFGKQVGAEFKA